MAKAKAKAKAARHGSDKKRPQRKTGRTAAHPSGSEHRKKAKVRRMTHRVVFGVLEFATHGLWPLRGSTPEAWLSANGPSESGSVVASPTLAALQKDLLNCLERIEPWRRVKKTGALEPENAFTGAVEAAVEEGARRGTLDGTFRQIMNALNICSQVLEHLEKDERWRNVYKCVTCGRWFFAWKHDPRNQRSPYCSRGCWSSIVLPDSLAPPFRVQSPKK